MSHLVDMSIAFDEKIPRWKLQFESVYNTTSYKSTTLHLSVHTATHLDSPLHYIDGSISIEEFPLEWMIRDAMIIDISYAGENYAIEVKDIEPYFNGEYPGVVILRTDWYEKKWGTINYWQTSPYVTEDAARWLAEKKIDIIGYDFPQDFAIRHTLNSSLELKDFYVHTILTEKSIWQLEYLANLKSIKKERIKTVICPLPLIGLEASPVRVIGIVADD